ncbi:MAG TPA: hypothetical protein VGF75_00235 [Candidatus Saccharimonadales bacterium]|jgi:hypothetical protein
MPRLTKIKYFTRHQMVRQALLNNHGAFSFLSANQQKDMHDFYATAKDLTQDELLSYRDEVTKRDPSLPQRASRAFLAALEGKVTKPPKSKSRITIHPALKPDLDIDLLAKALLDFVENLPPEQKEKFAAEGEKIKLGLKRSKRAA